MKTFVISVSLKNGEKYSTQIEAESLEQVRAMIDGQQQLELRWEEAFALINTSEIASIVGGVARPREEEVVTEDTDVVI